MAKKAKERRKKVKGSARVAAEKRGQGTRQRVYRIPDGMKPYDIQFGKDDTFVVLKADFLPYEVSREDNPELRVMPGDPPEVGDLWYTAKFMQHRIQTGPKNTEIVLCPRTFTGKECPICERFFELKRDKDTDDKVSLKFYAQTRFLYCLKLPKDDSLYLLDLARGNFQELLDTELSTGEEEFGFFHDPEEGYTLKIRFSKASYAGNSYPEATRIDFIDRKNPIPDSVLDEVPALDSLFEGHLLSYSALEAKMYGNEEDYEEEEEEGDRSTPSRKKRGRKVKEEEPEEEEPEEEEEEPPPKKKRGRKVKEDREPAKKKRRGRKAKEEEEEEDDIPFDDDPEEEEEESEPEPKKKKGKNKDKGKKDSLCPIDCFGENDEHDECDDCEDDTWQKCYKVSQE